MGRAPCCDKANVKRGPWSPEEDATLKNYVHSHGTGGNWIALPAKAGLKRCGKSCRLRWLNYLRPDIKHGSFTPQEDSIICSYYNQIGSRWSIIASQLPGRTDNDVKNYWNTKLKKKLLAGKVTAVNNSSSSSTTSSSSATSYTCVPKKEPSMVSATDQSSTTTCYGLQDYTMYSPLLPSHNLHDQYAANSMEGPSISSDSSSILPNQLCGDDQDLGFGFGGFLPNYNYNIWYPNMDGADFSLASYVDIKPLGLLNRSSHHQLTNQY